MTGPAAGAEVKGGRLLVEALRSEGVDTLFGMIGSHVTEVYDALPDSGIRTIDVRHEQAAAYMADGYARATGRPGVAVVTAGPGALNTLTGVGTAFADSSPILVIAGQVPSDVLGLGKGAFHECPDQLGIFRPFFEYPPYRSAFENVYLCGASTHPGGSISGACGRNAAGAIADDLGLAKWWNETPTVSTSR